MVEYELVNIKESIARLLEKINPDNNDLPNDSLEYLEEIQTNCNNLYVYLNDFTNYDPGQEEIWI